jgi:hypothetical protein
MVDPPKPDRRLRLRAEDDEDLAVVAAVLQDAVVRIGDLAFLPSRRQFVGLFTRFCWEAVSPAAPDHFVRVRTGLYLDTVRSVRARAVPQDRPDTMLSLLTLHAEPVADGVALDFRVSGGGEIRIEVECIDAQLSDFGQSWYTRHRPTHSEIPVGSELGR